MYNKREAAEYTGKGVMTVRRAIESGELIGLKISKRIHVFTQSELDKWAKTVRYKSPPRKDTP